MNEYLHTITDTDLASRRAAAGLRARIEEQSLAGERVTINLASVLSISESYADELFGVLAARHGLEWFSRHVVIRDANAGAFRAIASAIRQRLQASAPGKPDIALLVARKALESRRQTTV